MAHIVVPSLKHRDREYALRCDWLLYFGSEHSANCRRWRCARCDNLGKMRFVISAVALLVLTGAWVLRTGWLHVRC